MLSRLLDHEFITSIVSVNSKTVGRQSLYNSHCTHLNRNCSLMAPSCVERELHRTCPHNVCFQPVLSVPRFQKHLNMSVLFFRTIFITQEKTQIYTTTQRVTMEQEPQDVFPNCLINQELTSKHHQVFSAGVFFPNQIQRSTQQTWVSLQ